MFFTPFLILELDLINNMISGVKDILNQSNLFSKGAMLYLLLLVVFSLFNGLLIEDGILTSYSSTEIDKSAIEALAPLSRGDNGVHLLGTDKVGRDVLAGMLDGIKYVLSIGILAMGLASLIGVVIGLISGFYGDDKIKASWLDFIVFGTVLFLISFYGFISTGEIVLRILIMLCLSVVVLLLNRLIHDKFGIGRALSFPVDLMSGRLIEVVVTIPSIFLILTIVSILKPSVYIVMLVIGFTQWTSIARLVRAEVLRIKQLPYVESAISLGLPDFRVIVRHILPNAIPPMMVSFSFGVASAILIEATLSFLGLGVPDDVVTWGGMLSQGKGYNAPWWLVIIPGFAIFTTVAAFNIIGDQLQVIFDPKKS